MNQPAAHPTPSQDRRSLQKPPSAIAVASTAHWKLLPYVHHANVAPRSPCAQDWAKLPAPGASVMARRWRGGPERTRRWRTRGKPQEKPGPCPNQGQVLTQRRIARPTTPLPGSAGVHRRPTGTERRLQWHRSDSCYGRQPLQRPRSRYPPEAGALRPLLPFEAAASALPQEIGSDHPETLRRHETTQRYPRVCRTPASSRSKPPLSAPRADPPAAPASAGTALPRPASDHGPRWQDDTWPAHQNRRGNPPRTQLHCGCVQRSPQSTTAPVSTWEIVTVTCTTVSRRSCPFPFLTCVAGVAAART